MLQSELDVDFKSRLMLLWRALLSPGDKPPVNRELDKRLDRVDVRLDRLAASYRRGDRAMRRR